MPFKVRHNDACMCDACIQKRTKAKIAARETDEAVRRYEKRRGGAIGSISVSEALKTRKKK